MPNQFTPEYQAALVDLQRLHGKYVRNGWHEAAKQIQFSIDFLTTLEENKDIPAYQAVSIFEGRPAGVFGDGSLTVSTDSDGIIAYFGKDMEQYAEGFKSWYMQNMC